MASGNFPACLKVSLGYEGGWAKHPKDPGGATMKGITLRTFRSFKPGASEADLRAISDTDVEMIYRKGYWNPIAGDDLPYGIDLATNDYAINSGVGRAAKELQAVVGVDRDGRVGPGTIAAVNKMNGKMVVQKLCARRLSFVRGLKTWSTFGKGWSKRIANVEAKGVAMALSMGGTLTTADRKELAEESKKAKDTASKQTTGAGGVGAGGAGGLAATDFNWTLIVFAVILVTGAVAFLAWRGRVNKDRADAYRAVATA